MCCQFGNTLFTLNSVYRSGSLPIWNTRTSTNYIIGLSKDNLALRRSMVGIHEIIIWYVYFKSFANCITHTILDKTIFVIPSSILHLQHSIGLFCYGEIVGNDDHGAAIVMGKAPEDLHDIPGIGGIQIARRFVSKDNLTSLGQRPGNSYTLLLTAGEVAGQPLVVGRR